MTVLAHPVGADPLIAEAKRRTRRRRWLAGAALVAATAAGAVAIVRAEERTPSRSVAASTTACGISTLGTEILRDGATVYRVPGHAVNPNAGPAAQVQCSAGSIWVVWPFLGAGTMQEAYFGVRSSDAGRTWRPVFSEGYFPPKAPHRLDSYFGTWTLSGSAAYFAGYCPACSNERGSSLVSLWVTKDGGRTFESYAIPALTGYAPQRVEVSGSEVTIVGKHFAPGTAPHKSATVRVR